MPWFLLDLRVILGIALVATGVYAKVQTVRMEQAKAELAQFRADVETEAAKSRVAAAQEVARQAQNATEVLSDLQTRHSLLRARYAALRVRDAGPSTLHLPSLPGPAPGPSPVSGGDEVANADARCVAALEWGDKELAKFRELWDLWGRNAAP